MLDNVYRDREWNLGDRCDIDGKPERVFSLIENIISHGYR